MKYVSKKYLATVSAAAIGLMVAGPTFAADIPDNARFEDPAPAGRTISGFLEFALGKRIEDNTSGYCSTSGECEPWLFGAETRVDVPFNDNLSLQLDFGGVIPFGFSSELSSDDEWYGSVQGGAHISYREMDQYLFGVFAGAGRYWIPSDYDNNANTIVAGVEGQYYWNNFTLYGQGGFLDGTSEDNGHLDNAWFLRGVGRYFFNNGHTKVEGEVAYASGEADDDDADLWSLGAEVEHQVFGWNQDGHAAIFARYNGVWADTDDDNESPTDHRFMIGMKLAMNQYSLLTQDRSGATLELPNFNHWSSTVCIAECN